MKKLAALLLILTFFQGAWAIEAPIADEFALETLKSYRNVPLPKGVKTVIIDEFARDNLNPADYKNFKKPVPVYISADEMSVFVSSVEFMTTKKGLYESKYADFIVAKDVIQDGKTIFVRGEKITGRVEIAAQNGPFGSPAELVVSNFSAKEGSKKLAGEIRVVGANRSFWVYPIGYSINFFFPFAGVPVYTIRGGHAKIKPEKEFELVY